MQHLEYFLWTAVLNRNDHDHQGRATPERLNAFRNVGRLMGLCLLQNELCPLFLNRHVIKVC